MPETGEPDTGERPAPRRNLLLSGGVSHPFGATSKLLAELLAEAGFVSEVIEDIEAGVAELSRPGAYDLVTFNTLRWRMLADRFAPLRPDWALSLSESGRRAVTAHLAGGGGILAVHAASICFDDWPEWRQIVGAAWNWDRSGHLPVGPVRVEVRSGAHPVVDAVSDFDAVDEVYGFLDYEAGLEPLATAETGGVAHPVLWARTVNGGRVVYDALGHDERSFTNPAHRTILRQAACWAAARPQSPRAATLSRHTPRST